MKVGIWAVVLSANPEIKVVENTHKPRNLIPYKHNTKCKSYLATGPSAWSNLRHLDVRDPDEEVAARSLSFITFNFSDD